jgi:NAD(P)-dependent dehydrogenase (short-subunit alcohol dehydrogenase family)
MVAQLFRGREDFGGMDKLIKPVLIVTGSSRGIGAATARLAADRGYAVCVNYLHNQAAADRLVAEIEIVGGEAIAVAADVADEADVIRLFATVDQELGKVTALVNNAGILAPQTRLEFMDAARLNRIFATNITGSFLCAREAVKRMSTLRGGQGGAIVNVSSGASRTGSPHEYIDYAASKGAIDTLTFGLAKEMAEEGIRVNAVRPGIIDTEIHASGGAIPMGRGGRAIEVAQAILWLLSDEATYTTGALLDVAGGW